MATQDHHERLHKLLRGERAAVDSYQKALADLGEHPSRGVLQTFLEDHRRAVSVLSKHIAEIGEEPDQTAGPWGAFARAVETAASWIDDATTLKALKEGEVHGLDEYRTALGLATVPDDLRPIVENELLPRQQEHLHELDQLIARAELQDRTLSLPERIAQARSKV